MAKINSSGNKSKTKPRAPVKNQAPKATDEDNNRIKESQPQLGAQVATGLKFAALEETKDYVKAIFWGREGSSKTTSAAHATSLGPVLVINAEAGLKLKALQRQGVDTSKIAVYPDPNEENTTIDYETLEAIYFQLKSDLMQDPNAWAAVVIDSVTEVAEALVGQATDNRVGRAEARAEQQGIKFDDSVRWDTDRNDYGVMSKQFRDLLRKYRDLPCHLILTALERRDVDEDTGQVAYGPALSPGIQKEVLGYMDLVLYFKEAERETKNEPARPYRAVTHNSGRYRSKDRYGLLPQVLVEPTFTRIHQYLQEELTQEQDPLQQTPEPKEAPEPVKGKRKTKVEAAPQTETENNE